MINPVISSKWKKFKSIKRGYYSLIILCFIYLLTFLNPLILNNKALIVKCNNNFYFPAFRDLLIPVIKFNEYDPTIFGLNNSAINYRDLKKQFTQINSGNWIVMPIYPFSPNENFLNELKSNPPTAPDSTHLLGTDNQGRDILARLVYGFRISVTFGILGTLISFFLGIILGSILGYFGGKIDLFGLRIIEIISGIPILYLTMILVSFIKPSFILLCSVLAIFGGWIGISYYIRGEFYREKNKDYVLSAISIGQNNFNIILKHILPNALTPIIAFAPFYVIGYIGALVSLDFLGLGLPPPTASLGELLNQGVSDIDYWWLVVFPVTVLFLTLLMITFIGESFRESNDPKSKN